LAELSSPDTPKTLRPSRQSPSLPSLLPSNPSETTPPLARSGKKPEPDADLLERMAAAKERTKEICEADVEFELLIVK